MQFTTWLCSKHITGECGARDIYLRDDLRNITSPGFPSPYKNELICQWSIITSDNHKIRLRILNFEVERGYDFLNIRNSGYFENDAAGMVVELTGRTKLRSITSSGTDLVIQFATDRTGTRMGFHIELTRVRSTGKTASFIYLWRLHFS